MEAAKFWGAATSALVLVLCTASMTVTWHCINEVARLQYRVEKFEAEVKESGIFQILDHLGLQTPVYQPDNTKEEIPGHQRVARHFDLNTIVAQIVRAELEAHLPGPKGNTGPSGPPGPQGKTGDQGQKGDQGERGEQGFKGKEGEKGEAGEQGLQGVRGERGEKGDMGTRGSMGEKGERGDTGTIGPKGEKGQLGYPGYKGQKGESGEKGVQGLPGPMGEKGETSHHACPYVCGGTTGWSRVAYLDMTNSDHQCPGDMVEVTLSGKRVCGRGIPRSPSCVSAVFSTNGLQYSRVCGRLTGYQYGAPDAFAFSQREPIESYYVDGVSVTHGRPGSREHVWTFATGNSETAEDSYGGVCPCTPNARSGGRVPSFVGEHYFCESGRRTGDESTQFYTDDPLWDGDGCSVSGNTCCEFNNPPYFTRYLTNTTSDDLEVRACGDFDPLKFSEDTMIEIIELYIK